MGNNAVSGYFIISIGVMIFVRYCRKESKSVLLNVISYRFTAMLRLMVRLIILHLRFQRSPLLILFIRFVVSTVFYSIDSVVIYICIYIPIRSDHENIYSGRQMFYGAFSDILKFSLEAARGERDYRDVQSENYIAHARF